ncbi:MAG: hypothetical protein L0206_02885 [Actinobacteria bacterium]|nr:hypothetical protein [Actinomycetota bacterium]
MVHALEEIRRLLRRGGTLIDIHPVLEAPTIEVHSGDTVSFAELDPGYDYEGDLRYAEDAVGVVLERGLFVLDGRREFDFITYGSSVAELRDFMAKTGAYDDRPEDQALVGREAELYARVEDVMRGSREQADVAYHERGRMTRLTPR